MEQDASVSGTKRERYILRSVAKSPEPLHAMRSQREMILQGAQGAECCSRHTVVVKKRLGHRGDNLNKLFFVREKISSPVKEYGEWKQLRRAKIVQVYVDASEKYPTLRIMNYSRRFPGENL